MGAITGSNYLYLNVSCGKLVNKKKEVSIFAYEGILMGIEQTMDEFEGKQISKIKLKMQDNKSDEVALISFSEESWYSQGFFARISKADLSKPLTLGVSRSDVNEKVSFCWIKQNGETIKVEKGSFATPTKTSRGKDSYDAMLAAIEPVMEDLKKKLAGMVPAEQTSAENKPMSSGAEVAQTSDLQNRNEQESDLPFFLPKNYFTSLI